MLIIFFESHFHCDFQIKCKYDISPFTAQKDEAGAPNIFVALSNTYFNIRFVTLGKELIGFVVTLKIKSIYLPFEILSLHLAVSCNQGEIDQTMLIIQFVVKNIFVLLI